MKDTVDGDGRCETAAKYSTLLTICYRAHPYDFIPRIQKQHSAAKKPLFGGNAQHLIFSWPASVVSSLFFRALRGDAVATWMWMVEKSPPQAEFLGGLPPLSMGWGQSPVDGNEMGWKLLCVVMGWEGKFLVLGWDGVGNF